MTFQRAILSEWRKAKHIASDSMPQHQWEQSTPIFPFCASAKGSNGNSDCHWNASFFVIRTPHCSLILPVTPTAFCWSFKLTTIHYAMEGNVIGRGGLTELWLGNGVTGVSRRSLPLPTLQPFSPARHVFIAMLHLIAFLARGSDF